jgi:NSS family neurotransmitter:Na+ symporter
MITYSSYVSRDQNLGREAVIIALSDFSVAFVAGLVVFPVVFALGLSEEVGESTLGVLFISLPSAFARMEEVGRAVGSAFFLALIVAALTSAVSLLEVIASVGIDQLGMTRRRATLIAGATAAALGVGPALSQNWLGIMDQLAAELFTVLGVLGVALLVGWAMKNPVEELLEGASPAFARVARIPIFLVRWVAPLVLGWIAWIAVRETLAVLSGAG